MRHSWLSGRGVAAVAAILLVACSGRKGQLRKASSYLEDGRSGAAVRAYEKILEKRPADPDALLGVARAWIADGNPERAIVPAQVAVELGVPGARAAMARALLETGRGAEAVPLLRQAQGGTTDPQHSARLKYLLAEALLAKGDVPAATSTVEEALQAGAGTPAQSLGGWLHARSGNCGRATALAGRAITTAMSNPVVQAEAAAVFRHCGDAERAQAAASTALTLQSQGQEPWQHEAARYSKGGDLEGAARRMSRLRAVWPDEGRHARDLGGLWAALGEAALAQHELSAALELAPFSIARGDGVQVVNRSADAMDRAGRRSALKKIYEKLAIVRSELGDNAGRADALTQVARLEIDDPTKWAAAALAWSDAGQAAKGAPAALEAVALAPRNPEIQIIVSRVFAQAGDMGRAIGHGRIAWELQPGNADLALDLSELYIRRGEKREARRILKATAARVPGDPRLAAAIKRLDQLGP